MCNFKIFIENALEIYLFNMHQIFCDKLILLLIITVSIFYCISIFKILSAFILNLWMPLSMTVLNVFSYSMYLNYLVAFPSLRTIEPVGSWAMRILSDLIRLLIAAIMEEGTRLSLNFFSSDLSDYLFGIWITL